MNSTSQLKACAVLPGESKNLMCWVALISLCSAGRGVFHQAFRVFGLRPRPRAVLDKVWAVCQWQRAGSLHSPSFPHWPLAVSSAAFFCYFCFSLRAFCFSGGALLNFVCQCFTLAFLCSVLLFSGVHSCHWEAWMVEVCILFTQHAWHCWLWVSHWLECLIYCGLH